MTEGWSVPTCPVTGELLGSGEVVSRSAVNRMVTQLSDLPELMGDLEYASSGLCSGEFVGGGVPSSTEPVNLSLALEVWALGDGLWEWAQALTSWVMGPRYQVRRDDWRLIRQAFVVYADHVRRWVEAPMLIEAVDFAMHRLEALASPARRRLVFAGRCPACTGEVMAREDAESASCRGCGVEVDVAEARSAMLAAAGERPLPRPRAREVAEILVHRPIPDATVRQWCSRGRLAPVNVRGGVRLYRPRDIADMALVSAS